VKTYPSVPRVDDAPDLLEGGHLWVQELLDGAHLRFQLRSSGVLRFGSRRGTFGDDPPLAYGHAVRHVQRALDREALRTAVDDVETVTFFAEAMHRQAVDYDWHRTPSVLGFDVWDEDRDQFLPPDAVERVFERLGLETVNAFEKEVRAADFDPDVESFPPSAWRDGPAAGLFVRSKTGGRATLPNPAVDLSAAPDPLTGTAEALAARYATDARLERVAAAIEREAGAVTFDPLFEGVLESVFRAAHDRLTHGGTEVAVAEFRSAVAARTDEWLAARGRE